MREIDKIYFNTTKKSFNRSREKSEKKILYHQRTLSVISSQGEKSITSKLNGFPMLWERPISRQIFTK